MAKPLRYEVCFSISGDPQSCEIAFDKLRQYAAVLAKRLNVAIGEMSETFDGKSSEAAIQEQTNG
jgi:hypothetical protein